MKTEVQKRKDKIYGLRYDTSFKNVFHNHALLKQFFRDIFHEELEDIIYIDKEILLENKYLSYSIFDLLIERNQEYTIFEMQNQDLKNIEARITMYLSRYYARQNAGKKYEKIKPIKMRLILNYPYGEKQVLKEYQAMEKRLLEQFGIYFDIKIWNIKEALKQEGTLDYKYALLFILDMVSKRKAREILKELKKEKRFEQFVYKIELYNADLKMYEKLKSEEAKQMRLEDVAEAYKEEGIEIGEKRGKKLGIMQTALLMLKKGAEISFIKEVTGLTEKELLKLQKEPNILS